MPSKGYPTIWHNPGQQKNVPPSVPFQQKGTPQFGLQGENQKKPTTPGQGKTKKDNFSLRNPPESSHAVGSIGANVISPFGPDDSG